MTDEVVTHATTTLFLVGGLAKPVALITLDNGLDQTGPNTFGHGGLISLNAAFDAALAGDPAAIAVTGKPGNFSLGADLAGIGMDRATTLAIGKLGHDTFRRFTDSTIPTFAFLNGVALGGGLELALSCHYRTVTADVPALGFPECALGLFQGWGGTQLLPNLVGPDHAVTVIIENALNHNKMLTPADALALGVADALLDPPDYLDASLRWAAGVVGGSIPVPRPDIDRGAGWDAAITRAHAIVEAQTHGASPGPLRAVELLELARHNDLTRGYVAETAAMADVLLSDELRASLYAFAVLQERATPPGAPDPALARPLTTVGILGTGAHTTWLGLAVARQLGVPVTLTGAGDVHAEIDRLLAGGQIEPDDAYRCKDLVTAGPDPDACLVIDAGDAPAGDPAAIGLRFGPVAGMPLLEVTPGGKTDDATLATALAAGQALGTTCVLVADSPAGVAGRLLTRLLGEIVATLDEGTPFPVADHALDPLGLRMPPTLLIQLIGPAALLHSTEALHAAYPERFVVSENLRWLAGSGKASVWKPETPTLDPEVAARWRQGAAPSTADQVRDRALAALADEIRRVLDEGVVADPQDIDLCLIMGAGFPFWLGGITPYLDRAGVSERVTGRRFLPPGVADAHAERQAQSES